MPDITTILVDINTRSDNDKEQLFNALGEILTLSSYVKNLTQEVRESRFSKCKVCPHCDSEMVSIKANKDISVSPAKRLSEILYTLLWLIQRSLYYAIRTA